MTIYNTCQLAIATAPVIANGYHIVYYGEYHGDIILLCTFVGDVMDTI